MVYLKVSRRVASKAINKQVTPKLNSTPLRLTIEHSEPVDLQFQPGRAANKPAECLSDSFLLCPRKPKIHLPEITNYGTCSHSHYRQAMAQTPAMNGHREKIYIR